MPFVRKYIWTIFVKNLISTGHKIFFRTECKFQMNQQFFFRFFEHCALCNKFFYSSLNSNETLVKICMDWCLIRAIQVYNYSNFVALWPLKSLIITYLLANKMIQLIFKSSRLIPRGKNNINLPIFTYAFIFLMLRHLWLYLWLPKSLVPSITVPSINRNQIGNFTFLTGSNGWQKQWNHWIKNI